MFDEQIDWIQIHFCNQEFFFLEDHRELSGVVVSALILDEFYYSSFNFIKKIHNENKPRFTPPTIFSMTKCHHNLIFF